MAERCSDLGDLSAIGRAKSFYTLIFIDKSRWLIFSDFSHKRTNQHKLSLSNLHRTSQNIAKNEQKYNQADV